MWSSRIMNVQPLLCDERQDCMFDKEGFRHDDFCDEMWVPFDGVRKIPGLSSSVHENGRFMNPPSWNVPEHPTFFRMLPFLLRSRPKPPADFSRSVTHSTNALSEKVASLGVRRCVWLGHACFFVQLENGIAFVTDPVLTEKAGPLGLIGPKRITQAGCTTEELKRNADFVLISHSHYDHLSLDAVRAIGNQVQWFVPTGLGQFVSIKGGVATENVCELDWGEQVTFRKKDGSCAVVSCLPTQHWSKRTPFDYNKSLWASWSVHTKESSIFFGGDTALCPEFKAIGQVLGPFDLSFIGIGAYEPHNLMCGSHSSPEEAVQMHLDLNSKRSVGMHFATWILSDEPVDEPAKRLAAAVANAGLNENSFTTVKIGEWFY